jgi:metal-responsive CopG/Arc/MetJ family transcriptional regulator
MKVKTSVTLSEDIVKQLDAVVDAGESRSQVIERMLREAFAKLERQARDLRDLEIINRNADRLNEEAEDVLSYQVEL